MCIRDRKNKVESIVKAKLTEGTEVSSNSMKALNNNQENAAIANNIKKIAQIHNESAGVHQPAAGPINLTITHKITKPPIPYQLAFILNFIKLSL